MRKENAIILQINFYVTEANCNRDLKPGYCVGDGLVRTIEMDHKEFLDFLKRNNYFLLYKN